MLVINVLSLTEKNGVTVASDGDFSIELPSEWNSGNFFVMKSQDAEGVSYQFISRNNFMYGSGGMVFNLVKNIGEYEGQKRNFLEPLGLLLLSFHNKQTNTTFASFFLIFFLNYHLACFKS